MTQAGGDNSLDTHGHIHGDELMTQLRQGWRALPNKTLFALAMGGLRVRMMRSVVTMLSVVLAIAFLTYTGLNNYLSYNLAVAVQRYASFDPISPGLVDQSVRTLEGLNLFAAMPDAEQRSLAVKMGFDDTTAAEAELVTMPEKIKLAKFQKETDAKKADVVIADPKALKSDIEESRLTLVADQGQIEALEAKDAELKKTVAFGKWLKGGDASGDEAMQVRMTNALSARYLALVGSVRNPAQLSEADLAQLNVFLALASPKAGDAMKNIDTALLQERDKRSATDLRKMLNSSGVNIEKTIIGNPMDTWLLTMALLTCAVGIANAMLMSVTERFREIGTMKCLGAQDNLVIKLFLLESAFLGVIGALIGIVLGVVVAIVAALLQFNGFGVKHFPVADTGKVILGSLVGGVVLAVVGAVYPAIMAARMRPVDALRVDE